MCHDQEVTALFRLSKKAEAGPHKSESPGWENGDVEVSESPAGARPGEKWLLDERIAAGD